MWLQSRLRNILKVIDCISEWTGKTSCCLCIVLIIVMTYEVIMRYAFNAPNLWAFEIPMMLGATMYAMSWAYIHRYHAHIRIDVLYTLLPPRGKAIIDVIGGLVFFMPLVIVLVNTSISAVWRAWTFNEKMAETYWYPSAVPLKAMIALGICLLAIQGASQFFRDFYLLIKGKTYDST